MRLTGIMIVSSLIQAREYRQDMSTMSIFVDTLSFAGPDIDPAVTAHLRDAGKIAVLVGSLCAGVLGSLLITVVHKAQEKK